MSVNGSSLQDNAIGFRRGAIMGLTIAESFMLIAFALLMLLALWRMTAEEEAKKFAGLSADQLERLVAVSETGGMDVLLEIAESGSDLTKLRDEALRAPASRVDMVEVSRSRLEDIEERARLVSEDDVRRLAELAAKLDPDLRRRLEDLIRLEDFRAELERLAALDELVADHSLAELREALAALDQRTVDGASEADVLRDKIQGLLERDVSGQESLVRRLRDEIGDEVTRMGGKIEDDGAVVLPDALLFEKGEAEILPRLATFLEGFCSPWLFTLKESGLDIGEIRIEGHASSEWGGADPKEAFVRNLDLSQRRAQAVLERCLNLTGDNAGGEWARRHLTAVGFSSSRVIVADGVEVPEQSRRVVFSTSLSREQLLQEIGGTVTTSAPQPAGDTAAATQVADGSIFGRASVIDGDTIEIRGQRIRLHGIDAPESGQFCDDAGGRSYRCGQVAALFLSDTLGAGTVRCEERDVDRWGRIVAECFARVGDVDAVNVNELMVEAGHALAYRRYSRDYVEVEDRAKAEGRGVWVGAFQLPWEWRREN